jgi:hypothetical protein
MSSHDEDPSITNSVTELQVFIDRPISQVWKQFLDLGSWVTSHQIEEISEEKRTIGAITRVSNARAKELGLPLPHHHYCKLIKLVPERQYVLKAYSEKGGSYGTQYSGFDDARFVSKDGGTELTFSFYDEIRSDRTDVTKSTEASDDGMKRNLLNLKRIVEGQPRAKG